MLGQVVATATPGLFTYSAAHQYLNNPPGEPTGGTYDIHVSVSDDVSTTSADTSIVVNNAPPSVRIESTGQRRIGDDQPDRRRDRPGGPRHRDAGLDADPERDRDRDGHRPELLVHDPQPGRRAGRDRDGDRQRRRHGQRQRPDRADPPGQRDRHDHHVRHHDHPGRRARSASTPSAGADQVIGLVYGSNDLVDASSLPATTDVELDGYGSNETLIGGAGDDLLVAGTGANSLVGGAGNDTLVSNRGDDTLSAAPATTSYRINPGPDPLVVDPSGFNTLDFSIASLADHAEPRPEHRPDAERRLRAATW